MKQTSNHTPGPWEREKREIMAFSDQQPRHPRHIATVHTASGIWDINEANASLISAAPDMLEALEHFMFCQELECNACYELAGAAITKAKGEKNE